MTVKFKKLLPQISIPSRCGSRGNPNYSEAKDSCPKYLILQKLGPYLETIEQTLLDHSELICAIIKQLLEGLHLLSIGKMLINQDKEFIKRDRVGVCKFKII